MPVTFLNPSLTKTNPPHMINARTVLGRRGSCFAGIMAAIVTLILCVIPNTFGALTVMGTKYHQDLMFPEFDCYWDGGQYPTLCPTNFSGATIYVYLKNTGA